MWKYILKILGLKQKPKPTPEFFTYYGDHSVCSNNGVLSSLTKKDVAHLSQAERDFFDYWRKDPFEYYSSSITGKPLTQEEECRMILLERQFE